MVNVPTTLSKRRILPIGIVLVLLLGLALSLALVFRHEIASLASLKQIDVHPLLYMEYQGDYGFDEFLKVGAQSDQDIERFVVKHLLKGLPINLNITGAGCSAFAAKNNEGERIFGRNFDFAYSPALILKTKPKEGYASISVVNLTYAGYGEGNLPKPRSTSSFLTLAAPYLAFEGMNEHGVVMALLAVPYAEPPQKPDRIMLNTTTAIRLVLDKAATVEEAMNLLRGYNYYFSGGIDCHYLLADRTGKSVVVEFMDGEVQFIETNKAYQVATNFIMFNDLNVGEGYDEFERYNIIEQALARSIGIIDEPQAMDLLGAVQIPNRTQWSVVYNQSTGKVLVCMNMRYSKVYEFSLFHP